MLAANQTVQVAATYPSRLRARIEEFLTSYVARPWVPPSFAETVAGQTGAERFLALVAAAGFRDEADAFLESVATAIECRGADDTGPVSVGEVELPYHLVVYLAEEIIPGVGTRHVREVADLEELLAVNVTTAQERTELQRVIDSYPVRLSWHVIRQMRLSRAVADQYRPFAGELDEWGEEHTWVGQFHRGILEQMYPNRVILLLNMTCPVYCRFCFRKHRACRSLPSPSVADIDQAIGHVRRSPRIEEVLLTGGDPFLNENTLRHAVTELSAIPHLRTLRLASRAVSYFPGLFLDRSGRWLDYLVHTNDELTGCGKRLELATHFVHPDELSIEAVRVITRLCSNGVPVYVQTPLVGGCNDGGPELVKLFAALRAAGAEIHYIFMPSHPIRGNRAFASTIARGLATARYLRAHLSDRAMPHISIPTSIGKIDWDGSGWPVERDTDPRYLWIRTPYTPEYFATFADLPVPGARENDEGTLDARLYAEAGAGEVLAGPRRSRFLTPRHARDPDSARQLWTRYLEDQRLGDLDLGAPASPALARVHATRVELDAGAAEPDLATAMAHLREQQLVTDVVVTSRRGPLHDPTRTLGLIAQLQELPQVTAIRLRCLELVATPELLDDELVRALAGHNRLTVASPCRLEVEITLLSADDLSAKHGAATGSLARRGITVYAHVPLCSGINDSGEEVAAIARVCRHAGIEIAHVYLAGLPTQDSWNHTRPIAAERILDIAAEVRRSESGRAIPRYLLRTQLGEIDFGIAPRVLVQQGGQVLARLVPYDESYYRAINAEFAWPEEVSFDECGQPLVPVRGLTLDAPLP